MVQSVILFFLFVSSVIASEKPWGEEYPSQAQLQNWNELSELMEFRTIFALIDSLYTQLPKQQIWPEPFKLVLLKVVEYNIKYTNAIWSQQRVPQSPEIDTAILNGYLRSMVNWQKDRRFIPYLVQVWSSDKAVPGLVAIGEPAFEAVVKKTERRGFTHSPINAISVVRAIRVIREWIQKGDNFLYLNLDKRRIAREALTKAAFVNDRWVREEAIQTLQYFTDPKIGEILVYINEIDTAVSEYTRQSALEYYRKYSQPLTQLRENINRESRIEPEQLVWPEYDSGIWMAKSYLNEYRDFLKMLAGHSNSVVYYDSGYFYTTEPDTVTFAVPMDSLRAHSVLNWETSLGYYNSFLWLQGYGLVTREKILRLQIENMRLRNAEADTIQQMQKHYRKIKRELDYFLATKSWAD